MAEPPAMQLVAAAENKEAVIRRILDMLPQWFGIEEAKEMYVRAARELPMFACVTGDEAVRSDCNRIQPSSTLEPEVANWHYFCYIMPKG
jgi:hypothetical protein